MFQLSLVLEDANPATSEALELNSRSRCLLRDILRSKGVLDRSEDTMTETDFDEQVSYFLR